MHRGLILVKLHQITSFHIFFNSLQGFTVLSGLYGNKSETGQYFSGEQPLSIYNRGQPKQSYLSKVQLLFLFLKKHQKQNVFY